jgi:3-deoxy-D-manno-octulosonic-acid transferase
MSEYWLAKTVYNVLALPLGSAAARAAGLFRPKIRESLQGLTGWQNRWHRAAATLAGRPVWFHVSSVGEYEQAKPLISALAADHPNLPVILTFCSPSGYQFAMKRESPPDQNNIKFIDYKPIDSVRSAGKCLDLMNPRLLVFVKFDLWPNLIWSAGKRSIPAVLVDGTLSATSNRVSGLARRFYRSVYESLDRIMAIGQEDANRFLQTAPDHPAVTVTGDTRFDRVMERRQQQAPLDINLVRDERITLIAGSTWPKDESRILPALARILDQHQNTRLVIAPHEPAPERVAELEAWASTGGFEVTRLSRGAGPAQRVIIVDSVGILAELYALCDLAYIGGSFSTGVHSVIEPAIMGMPVLFGPVHHNSLEAQQILKLGAGTLVTNTDQAFDGFDRLIQETRIRQVMGIAARNYVESQLGATQRCMRTISEYL